MYVRWMSTEQIPDFMSYFLRCGKYMSGECQLNRFNTLCLTSFDVVNAPCIAVFDVINTPDNERESASAAVTVTSTGPSTSHATTSVVSPSHLRGTRCLLSHLTSTRKRLAVVVKDRAEMRRKHLLNIKLLRRKLGLQSNSTAKRLNQKFKRKESQIQKRKAEQDGEKELELRRTKLALQKSRKNLRNLKMYHAHKDSNQLAREEEIIKLQEKLRSMSIAFRELENINLTLEERIASITHGESTTAATSFSKKGKRYSDDMRMFVYDAIVNQVPTRNIPILLTKFAQRAAIEVDSVPHRNTVEMMARELGAISDIQVAEVLMHQDNLTLGFDATTQEGVHLNSIHATTKSMCHVIAIDELPGGTAEDYQLHICESIDKLADVYATFHDADYQECRRKIISNIANTMTDRVVVNHAAITRVCEVWGKNLNELNCHLHPLDTIATATKASLTSCEPEKGQLFGKDCIAGNLVLQINKFRYKDGKCDPKGFVTFLDDEGLARGILPWYRGNILHILFHICGKPFEHHHLFLNFFKTGTVSCGGLQQCILRDFDRPTAKVEIQVLGLVGKLLSGPWMTTMYTSAEKQINHVDCIDVVRTIDLST